MSDTATRDGFKKNATGNRRYTYVDLPVSGLRVRIRSLTAREMADHQAGNFDRSGNFRSARMPEFARRLFVATCVDDDGNQLFTLDDLQMLGEMDCADAETLNEQIMIHCGLKRADSEAIRKNSEQTTSDVSQSV